MNIPILLYHSVSNQATKAYRRLCMTPGEFEEHLAYLQAQGYQPLTMDEIAQAIRSGGKGLPARPVAITFDDGLADFLTDALPICRKYHFPATLYVTTGYVGQTSRFLAGEGEQDRLMLAWDEIRALEGVNIGAHTHTHPQLDIIPLSQAKEEIQQSKNILEQELGFPVTAFSFTFGYYTRGLQKVVRQAGFTSACTVGHAMASTASDILALPRIIITPDVTISVLEKYLQGIGLRRQPNTRIVERMLWRMWRWSQKSLKGPQ